MTNIPIKPWEMSGPSNIQPHYIPNTTGRLQSSTSPFPQSGVSGGGGGSVTVPGASSGPPPLPPRPAQTRPIYSVGRPMTATTGYMNPYSSYSTPYSSYSSPYSSYYNGVSSYGYGSPGLYGTYGYGANRYSSYPGGIRNPGDEPTFSELAEESSATAFQSIESFVGAFGSISAMLESTFHAVYSSFRAVVGVADHLGRVKEIMKTFAIFRFFRWMLRRIMYLIGISKIKPEQIENLWNSISSEESDGNIGIGDTLDLRPPRSKPSSWPIVMFLGFIFVGPYLMWKLIASLNLNRASSKDTRWASGEADHFLATPEYDFEPSNDRELRMKKGQTVRLAPAAQQPPNVQGWVLASDGVKIGLIPLTYIKVLGKRSGNPVPIRLEYNNTNTTNSVPELSSSPFPSPSVSRSSSQSTLKAGEN